MRSRAIRTKPVSKYRSGITISEREVELYFRFRMLGYSALDSLSNAKVVRRFQKLEREGKVRVRAEPEQESYWDVYGKPEAYQNAQGKWVTVAQETKRVNELIERLGCWYVVVEISNGVECECWETNCGCEGWEQVESVGMCVGYERPCSPFENCYVVGFMQAAIEEYQRRG